MKLVQILSILLIASSCASTLPPKEERSLTFVEETKNDKSVAYSNALRFIVKNFGDSSKVIKFQDKDSGIIILKGNTVCNVFRQAGDINDYLLQFTLEISFEIKKSKLSFEDLYISSNTGEPVSWEYNQITNKEKSKKASECLISLRNGLLAQ